MAAREWDAETYHRVSDPMTEMGRAVLERLRLGGDETVLDVGCGTGRVTALLAERLPRGRVIAVDASSAMVERARAVLGDRVDVIQADVLRLELPDPVDAVFSTATFHWILDHAALFSRLYGLLRPGGFLVAQCGGEGNIARLLEVAGEVASHPRYAESFAGWDRPMRFASDVETERLLAEAGFVDVRCWLEPSPVVPADPLAYLEAVTLGPHLERLPEGERRGFARKVLERMGEPVTIDYVRLNIDARRPA